jgi:hypothetical protein
MFKMPTGVSALVGAGLGRLACTDGSGLKCLVGRGNGGQAKQHWRSDRSWFGWKWHVIR